MGLELRNGDFQGSHTVSCQTKNMKSKLRGSQKEMQAETKESSMILCHPTTHKDTCRQRAQMPRLTSESKEKGEKTKAKSQVRKKRGKSEKRHSGGAKRKRGGNRTEFGKGRVGKKRRKKSRAHEMRGCRCRREEKETAEQKRTWEI